MIIAMGRPGPKLQSVGAHWQLTGSLKLAEGYSFDTVLPYQSDRNSGLPVGRSKHEPVTVVRRIDVLSPQIGAALSSQIVIPLVTVSTHSGQKVDLTNARVKSKTDTHEMEEIDFTFQKIEWTWNDGGKSASDDWESQT